MAHNTIQTLMPISTMVWEDGQISHTMNHIGSRSMTGGMVQAWVGQKLLKLTFLEFFDVRFLQSGDQF